MTDRLKQGGETDMDVAIVGSGFSGLGMAIRMRQAGYTSFTIFEKSAELGGTWYDNQYPGCACDVPSYLYSFSFEQYPYWSRMFATQPEIWRYLKRCADKYGLYPQIRFNAKLVEAAFDEKNARWHLRFEDGHTATARVLILGTGALHVPAWPEMSGVGDFQGEVFHSAHWPQDFDAKGKKVAVIGTGASAIQFVPEIAPDVAQMTVFQRTAPWIMPKYDRAMTRWEHLLFANLPLAQKIFRASIYWQLEFRALAFTRRPDLIKQAQQLAIDHMARQVPDAALRDKLTPDYTMGCKRVLISNNYYPALMRDNVELNTDGVAEIRAHSVVTREGREIPADVLIYGTGFHATKPLSGWTVKGRGGRDLQQEWNEALKAYYGLTVNGYPNLFFLLGPNTGLGHTSVVYMIEAQIQYALESLKELERRNVSLMEVRAEAQDRFNADLQSRMGDTVWATGCNSWYLTEGGLNSTLWPDFTFLYRNRTKRPITQDYDFS